MVDQTASTLVQRALIRVPDRPHWVDTRGMLLSGRALVRARAGSDPATDPFIAVVPDAALASIVGTPGDGDIPAAVHSLAGDVNVLCQLEDAAAVARALPRWQRRSAVIHTLPKHVPWETETDGSTQVFTRQTAPRFDHLPETLRRELRDALDGRTRSRFVPGAVPDVPHGRNVQGVPMAAVWADGRPVAFCCPVWQTESWWDVSIETLEAYRGKGLAGRAARTLIRHMQQHGRAPVWGALDTNAASRALAARLGFREAARIAVFTAA
jgi:RimJ/RimL family protein N-acetyltransferase